MVSPSCVFERKPLPLEFLEGGLGDKSDPRGGSKEVVQELLLPLGEKRWSTAEKKSRNHPSKEAFRCITKGLLKGIVSPELVCIGFQGQGGEGLRDWFLKFHPEASSERQANFLGPSRSLRRGADGSKGIAYLALVKALELAEQKSESLFCPSASEPSGRLGLEVDQEGAWGDGPELQAPSDATPIERSGEYFTIHSPGGLATQKSRPFMSPAITLAAAIFLSEGELGWPAHVVLFQGKDSEDLGAGSHGVVSGSGPDHFFQGSDAQTEVQGAGRGRSQANQKQG
jgi:hypothetical protein